MLNINDYKAIGYIRKKGVELKFAKGSGIAIGSFSLAVPKESKDKEKKEYNYFNVVCFKNTAEFLANNSSRIKSVYVEGHLQSRNYDKEVGGETIKIYVVEVVANRVQVVEWRNDDQADSNATSGSEIDPDLTPVDDGEIPF